jgi:hypothetical protein
MRSSYSIELEDRQTGLCIQHTRNIVCPSRKTSQWFARTVHPPPRLRKVGTAQGLMAPKVREFSRVFRDKQLTHVQRRDGKHEALARATPASKLVFRVLEPPFAEISCPQESNADDINSCL